MTHTHINWKNDSYEEDRNEHIKTRENRPLYTSRNNDTPINLNAHYDGRSSIALGYGYDLIQNRNNLMADLAEGNATLKEVIF